MRKLAAATATVAILAMFVGPVTVSANNDPHRSYFPNAPLDLDATFCAFPVHVDFPFQAEYGNTSTLADGSTLIKASGPLFVEITNALSGKAVTINSSSAGTLTIAPDGAAVTYDLNGRTFVYGPNLTAFGFPSNIVAIGGAYLGKLIFAPDGTFTWASIGGHYQVITDVCAALA